jgi:hypothetical protein
MNGVLNEDTDLTVLQPSDTVFANVSSASNVNFYAE